MTATIEALAVAGAEVRAHFLSTIRVHETRKAAADSCGLHALTIPTAIIFALLVGAVVAREPVPTHALPIRARTLRRTVPGTNLHGAIIIAVRHAGHVGATIVQIQPVPFHALARLPSLRVRHTESMPVARCVGAGLGGGAVRTLEPCGASAVSEVGEIGVLGACSVIGAVVGTGLGTVHTKMPRVTMALSKLTFAVVCAVVHALKGTVRTKVTRITFTGSIVTQTTSKTALSTHA